jgi:Ca-activated chloride channel family protein
MIPRQEITAVLQKRIDNRLAAMKRREVSLVERRPKAPDFAPAVDAAARRFEGGTGLRPANMPFGFAGLQDGHLPSPSDPTRPSRPTRLANEAETNAAAVLSERFAKPPENAQRFVAMDDRLAIAFHAYREPQEGGRLYFRIAIQPRTDKPMPVLPKDLLLVQDSSASLAEERLYFSRLALADAISQLGASDRFNVLAFSDQSTLCFPTWVPVNETNRATARTFIGALRSTGETDLFASLQRMLDIPRDPERPLVVVMVTDGRPTAGRLASTEIIGAFTKLNDGALSIFGFGTHARANTYLLDMLTYCNRGETRLNRASRWTLQKEITDFVASVRQPVMHDIRFAFDAASGSEVYPKQTTSLYADRPLEIFGSCAGDVRELALHMRGRAGGSDYDAVIQLDVARDAQAGEVELRTRWAWQRMYHVIGLYARDPKPLYRKAMERLNADYGIPIPYGNEMGR